MKQNQQHTQYTNKFFSVTVCTHVSPNPSLHIFTPSLESSTIKSWSPYTDLCDPHSSVTLSLVWPWIGQPWDTVWWWDGVYSGLPTVNPASPKASSSQM